MGDVQEPIKLLDHGYLRFVEDWGRGDAGVAEAGIIEAARQSTQGSFRGWEAYHLCEKCGECWSDEWGGWKITDLNLTTCTDGSQHVIGDNVKPYPKGDQGLLAFLFNGKPQHATPFEFCGMTIEVQAPIAVFREWHRHRTQSYNEMSARYAPLPDLNYIPTVERLMMVNDAGRNKQAGAVEYAEVLTEQAANAFREALKNDYANAENTYQIALKAGVAKELARLVLPVGRYSRMRACTNLRNWLAFMTLRADRAAQWEIRQYANTLGTIIAERFPRVWNLFCEAKQSKATVP